MPTPRAHRRSTMDVDGGRRRATGTPGCAATGRVGVRVPCSRPVEDHRRFAVVEPPSNGFLAGTAVALGGRAGRHRRAKMMAAGTRCPPAAWRCPLAWTPDGLHCSARNHDKPTCTGLVGCESECDASVTTTGRSGARPPPLTMFFVSSDAWNWNGTDRPANRLAATKSQQTCLPCHANRSAPRSPSPAGGSIMAASANYSFQHPCSPATLGHTARARARTMRLRAEEDEFRMFFPHNLYRKEENKHDSTKELIIRTGKNPRPTIRAQSSL